MKVEQLYRVTLPNGFILARCGKERHLNFVDETSVDIREPWEFNFTEKEIKKMEPKLMAFATEVAE